MNAFKTSTIVALLFVAASLPAIARDAMAPMAPASDAMAPAADTMTPQTTMISDADFEACLTQAAAITFPEAMTAATVACHGMHEGMDVMGAIRSLGMDEKVEINHMAPDAMAPAM